MERTVTIRTLLEYDIWIANIREDHEDFAEALAELARFEKDDENEDE